MPFITGAPGIKHGLVFHENLGCKFLTEPERRKRNALLSRAYKIKIYTQNSLHFLDLENAISEIIPLKRLELV